MGLEPSNTTLPSRLTATHAGWLLITLRVNKKPKVCDSISKIIWRQNPLGIYI